MMRGDPTEVQQALERSCKVILNAETRTMVEALLDQMLLENDLPRKYSEQVLELESLHLVLLLLRNGIFSHETMSPKEGYSADIERALKYIALNYQQPLTLEEVAGYCNLSPTYFSRKFRLITGQTFKEHVNYIRLRQATQKMADEMHAYFARGYTPKSKPGIHCSACSLKELCLPVLYQRADPKAYLRAHLDEMQEAAP